MSQLNWGILSTAAIARKNWRSLQIADNAKLIAVASRDINKSTVFIDQCQSQFPMPAAVEPLGSYDELLARPDIKAVYIPLPTAIRKEWILKALQAGKHVLSEKPVATTMADMKEIAEAVKHSKLQFMDGVMFAHSQRYNALLDFLHGQNGVGTVRRISTQFSFLGSGDFKSENIRSDATTEPLGCLGDLGWYCVRLILAAKNWITPSAVIGRMLHASSSDSESQVPSEFTGQLFFQDGTSASFFCSFLLEHQQWAHISGDKGNVFIDDFVLPFNGSDNRFYSNKVDFVVDGCDAQMRSNRKEHIVAEHSHGHPTAQEVKLFYNFSKAVLSKNVDWKWLDKSMATQRVISALKDSSDASSKLTELL